MDSESLIYLQLTSWAVLVSLFVLFPKDCLLILVAIPLWGRAVVLNYCLMFKAWRVHRQISRDLAKIGLPAPAFKFTSIWER